MENTAESAVEGMTAAQRAEFYKREMERYRDAYRYLAAAFDGAAAIAGGHSAS